MAKVCNRETYKVMSFMKNFGLNVKGGLVGIDIKVIGYRYNNGNNEKWVAQVYDGDYFSLTTRQSPDGGIRYAMTAMSDASIAINPYTGDDNQLWYPEPVCPQGFLCFLRNKTTNTYVQYNGDNQQTSLVAKVATNNDQKWSIQEVSIGVCVDGAWFDNLTWPKQQEDAQRLENERLRIARETVERERIARETIERERIERERIERERIERERIERERIERERIERERIEHDRIEKERADAEIREKERIILERELRIAELEKAEKNAIDASKAKAERELAEKEKEMAERERRLALLELEAREKTIRERELWLIERERLEKELREKLVIEHQYVTGGVADEDVAKKETIERQRLEQEQRDRDRIEHQRLETERIEREKRQKIEIENNRKEKELRELELVDREAAIRERERWLLEREKSEKTKTVIVYHVVRGKDGQLYRVPQGSSTTSTSTGTSGGSQTTHTTHSVEQRGDEKVTRDVTEIERVIKTVEYI